MRLGTKITLIFLVVFLLGGGLIFFATYQSRLAKGLDLEIEGPEQISVGVPFDVQVNVGNNSNNLFEDVRLSLNLPEGVAFLGSPASKNVDFRELTTIGVGGISQQTFKLIALSGENTFKRITGEVSYLSGSLSSRFQREASYDLPIGDFGLTLDIAVPQKIFSGETFDIEVSFENQSNIDYEDLRLKIDYPLTFNLTKSTLPPDVGNSVWVLGGLRKGSDMDFKITGNVIGPEGAFFDIVANIEASFLGETYSISTNAATLSIATSPLSLKIFLNEDIDYIAGTDEQLNYTLAYSNNTDIGLRDVVITAQMIGELFDFSGLGGTGIFRSTDNTLIWNASNEPALSTLSPGQSGQISFFVRTRKDYPIRRLGDKNFILKVNGTIESPTVPHFVAANKTFSLTGLETKVKGKTEIDTKAYFRDASSGILNTGPFPPVVNQPTQYTIHWQITNHGTDVENVEVRGFLGGNVRFTGVAKTSAGAPAPTFNERTQEVVWRVSKIPATAGVISKPIEAIFQVEATPSISDLSRYMHLIGDVNLTALDTFTELQLSGKDFGVTTQLPDDTSISSGQGTVKE